MGCLRMVTQSDSCSPFHLLPIEIVSHIFRLLIARDPKRVGLYESISRVRPLASITLVSKRWYDIAIQSPALWSTITITSKNVFPSHFVETWLDRAAHADLDVNLIGVSRRFGSVQLDVLPRLASLVGQIKILKAFLGSDDWAVVAPLLPRALPSVLNSMAWISASPNSLPSVSAPSLARLSNNGYMVFFSCTSLHTLEIRDLEVDQWAGYTASFKSMPNLRKLRVHSRYISVNREDGEWSVPMLEELILDLSTPLRTNRFLSVLSAPRLAVIYIAQFNNAIDPPLPTSTSAFPALQKIYFYHTWLSSIKTFLESALPAMKRATIIAELAAHFPRDDVQAAAKKELGREHTLILAWTAISGYAKVQF